MNQVLEGLKKRYEHVHPLIFQRSLEYSNGNMTHLFDILETIPACPFSWDDDEKCWKTVEDTVRYSSLSQIKKH